MTTTTTTTTTTTATVNDVKMMTVVSAHLDEVIVYDRLVYLASRGNLHAWDLMARKNGVIDFDDLKQEVCLQLALYADAWEIVTRDGKLRIQFYEDRTDAIKAVYGAVSRFMYSMAKRHYDNMYIEIDGDPVRVNSVPDLASHADIDAILNDAYISDFEMTLTQKEWELFQCRLCGNSIRESARIMNIGRNTARTIEKHLRKKWEIYNK